MGTLEEYQKLSSFDQWLLTMNCITGRATNDQIELYRAYRDARFQVPQFKQCESTRDYLMSTSPGVIFMLGELKKIGCEMSAQEVVCKPCVNQKGGFDPDRGIKLCSNQVVSTGEVEKTLMHELVHAFDRCRFKVDWSNPKHHACSEIRAASLSGECGWWREYKAGNTGITNMTKHHQDCVRRRAARSLAMNPNVKSVEEANFLVSSVFDSCFRDTRPFERIY